MNYTFEVNWINPLPIHEASKMTNVVEEIFLENVYRLEPIHNLNLYRSWTIH